MNRTVMFNIEGGVATFPAIQLSSSEFGQFANMINRLMETFSKASYQYSICEYYQDLIQSLQQPVSTSTIHLDLPCNYLGYKRMGKTSLRVRLREAINVLLGRPSHAYYTQEDGEYADGMFKDAYRVSLTAERYRNYALHIFNCKINQTPVYTIPLIKFITPTSELTTIGIQANFFID